MFDEEIMFAVLGYIAIFSLGVVVGAIFVR